MSDAASGSSSAAETALFDDILTCQPCLPARFVPMDEGRLQPRRRALQAERLLARLAHVEDSTGGEEPEEHGAAELALQRIEARLQLLAEQVAQLMRQDGPPMPEQPLTWSARGLVLEHGSCLETGTTGLVEIELVEWLPQPLQLPATVLACEPSADGGRLWLHFEPRPDSLRQALERHLFRLHRREIAEARRQR